MSQEQEPRPGDGADGHGGALLDDHIDGHPHDDHLLFGGDRPEQPGDRPRRRDTRRRRGRSHRRGAIIAVIGFVLVAAIGLTAYVFIKDTFTTPDYSGSGTSPVQVVIHTGDTASDIANTLVKDGVVKSAKAFTSAANSNSNAGNIQPGVYTLRKHMSGKDAVALLLTPSARDADSDVVVTEGATIVDVAARLAATLHQNVASVRAALNNVSQLALPSSYGIGSSGPTSAEGFLFPATYPVDPSQSVTEVANDMITNFIAQDRDLNFAGAAPALHLTPYQELIVASIAQAEAKFPDDMAKVARVILNRLAAHMPLQIDATSAYAAKLLGLNPSKVIYSEINSPYNSYTHAGLPPTPISNPGVEALTGAAKPAPGNWLYYVNSDAAGHLFFTNDQNAFAAAAAKCKANNWGCG